MSVPMPEGFDPRTTLIMFGAFFFVFMFVTWMVSRIAKKRRESRM